MQDPRVPARPTRPVRPGVQGGASMVEFLVVAPFLLLIGLGTVQLGLIYHGRTIVNYATFEAARTGAVNHALPEPMRRELAVRLAPLLGGDGSAAGAARAIARSIADVESPLGADGTPRPATRIELLSPPAEAFEDWGALDPVSGRRVIPNSHLRHRSGSRESAPAGAASGLTLADANLLEIRVVHGLELKVPLVDKVLTTALAIADPENAAWYAADRLPIASRATVRMQSDAWLAEAGPVGTSAPDGAPGAGRVDVSAPDAETSTDAAAGGTDGGAHDVDACGEHGLGGGVLPVSESAYASGECAVGGGGYAPAGLPSLPGGGGAAIPPGRSPGC